MRGIVVADTVPLPLTGRARLVKFAIRYLVTSGEQSRPTDATRSTGRSIVGGGFSRRLVTVEQR